MFTDIPYGVFQERTNVKLPIVGGTPQFVVPLRNVSSILSIQIMSDEYLKRLLGSIPLEGRSDIFPYRGLRFDICSIDPRNLVRAQTFVQTEKLLGLVSNFQGLLGSEFSGIKGFASTPPLLVFGLTAENKFAIAHYLPPIVEQHRQAGEVLLDGTHRARLVETVGGAMICIKIANVIIDFPSDVCHSHEIRMVDVKPDRPERYSGLKPDLFRNVGHVGIDG